MAVFAAASPSVDKKYVPGEPIANACVVTGANCGIGLEFCKQILAKSPGNSIVASCRDPNAADDLTALQKEVGESRLAVVALDVADETSIASWAEGLGALEPSRRTADPSMSSSITRAPPAPTDTASGSSRT